MRKFMIFAVAVCINGPALAEDLVFNIHNKTGVAITEFYTSPTDVDDWEEDVTGGGEIAAGETAQITIADGRDQCDYDIRMIFADDVEVIDTENLCDIGTYDVTE